jgi:hypothetical protein
MLEKCNDNTYTLSYLFMLRRIHLALAKHYQLASATLLYYSISILVIIKFVFYYLFDNVVVVAFQSIFYLKIYQNNFFYFLKIIFDIITSR